MDDWTPAFGLWHLLGLVSGARLNAKHTAIYISHITSRRQIEQDERVAKGIIDQGESTNWDLSRLEDQLSTASTMVSTASDTDVTSQFTAYSRLVLRTSSAWLSGRRSPTWSSASLRHTSSWPNWSR